MEKIINKNYIIQFLLILIGVAIIIIIGDMVKIDKLERNNIVLHAIIEDNNNSYDNLILERERETEKYKSQLTTVVKSTKDLELVVKELDVQLKTVMEEKEQLYEKLSSLKDREELFDKYEYAIIYSNKRTDLTYEQIKLGDQLMNEKGYDPNLLFGIIMTESRATEKATNSESTARGLGQFLKGTGKWVYEEILKLGTYNHDYAFNGETNIRMMVAYLDYLFKTNNYNLRDAIQLYRGSSGKPQVTQAYCNSIDSFITSANTSISKISRGMSNKK